MTMYKDFCIINIKINSISDLEEYHRLLTTVHGSLFIKNKNNWYNGKDVLALDGCDFGHCLKIFCGYEDAIRFRTLEYKEVS